MTEPADNTPARFERNVRLYPRYAAAFNAFAWMPVFFLYFSEHFSLNEVLLLEAIYYAAVVVMEVPSGYFSDRVGRRATLMISATSLLAAYVLFAIGGALGVFVAAQVLLAAGIAFNSGTDTSFHYDSLASLGRTAEYADREATVARNGLLAGGAAALAGGAIGMLGLRFAYVLSACAAAASVAIVLRFAEPAAHERCEPIGSGFIAQLGRCLALLRTPALAWLFAFSVLMTVLNHVPYEFYQPYIDLAMGEAAGRDAAGLDRTTPIVAGLHMAAAMLLGSIAAARSVRLRNRLGTAGALLAAGAIQVAVIAAMALVLSPWIIPLILLRVMPRALMTAPLNAAIAPQVPQAQRATYLSIQSLAGRLAFSATLAGLSAAAGPDAPLDFATLADMLTACLWLGGCGLAALLAAAPLLRRDRPTV